MLANFIPATGRISFVGVTIPGMAILDGTAWVRYRSVNNKLHQADLVGMGCINKSELLTDLHGTGRQQAISSPVNKDGIELSYRINNYDQRPFLMFQLVIHNRSLQPIFLEEMCLFQADRALGGRVDMPDAGSELRFLKVGLHSWAYTGLRTPHQRDSSSWIDPLTRVSYFNPLTPVPHRRGEFWSEGWGVLAGERAAMVAGFTSTARQFGQMYTCTRRDAEALMLVTQVDGIRLDPGETCESEWAYLQFITLPNPEPTADFVQAVSRQMKVHLRSSPPPLMWTHWYHFYHKVNENIILQNIDAMVKLRQELPIQVVELDDGYQTAWGDWTTTNSKFPHGLEQLAGQITAQGFTPGLWLAPLVVHGKSELAREHPDWLLRDQRGKPISAGMFYFMLLHALDPSHPQVLEHLYQLVDTLVHRWGYGMLKIDFLNAAALPGKRYNPKLTRAESLRLVLEAIRQAAGENTFLHASGCPFGPAVGLVDAMRIGPDTAPYWEPSFHWLKWASPFLKRNPSMPSLRNALRHTLNLSTLHQRWWWNDPDCLLVRERSTHLSPAEVQSAVTLVGLSGGMLATSDDLRKLSPERLRWVSLLVPNLGLRGIARDSFAHDMPAIYQVEISSDGMPDQSWNLVGLFNWHDRKAACRLRLDELGFATSAELFVFDFWSRRIQRLIGPEVIFPDVPAHGCKLLRISQVSAAPQVVGDTIHISQGAEIATWKANGDHITLESIDLVRRVEGDLWLSLSRAPLHAVCNNERVNIEDKGDGIYSLHLQFNGKAKVEIIIAGAQGGDHYRY